MIVEVYIKGKFKAKYTGKPAGGNADLLRTYQDFIFTEKWLFDAEEIPGYDQRVLTKEPYDVFPEIKDVYVSWKEGRQDVFFNEDFSHVVINEIHINKPATSFQKGELTAFFYGTYKVFKPDPKPIEIIKNQPTIINSNFSSRFNNFFNRHRKITDAEITNEPESVFNHAWQPDDFLSSFNVSRQQWDGWRTRWSQNWMKLAALIFGILLMLNFGWLSIPLMWIPFFYLLKNTGDVLLKIISPQLLNKQLTSVNSVNGFRRFFRSFYFVLLVAVCLFFLFKKLFLFAFIAGLFAFFHLITYSSPLFYFLRRIFQGLSLLLLLFAFLRLFNFSNAENPLPIPLSDDDNELIPDKPDSTHNTNQYTLSWNDYKNNLYKGSYNIAKNNYAVSFKNRVTQQPANSLSEVYEGCYKVDKTLVPALIKMFDSIKLKKQLDTKRFAEMIGCFIQRIPYVLVHEQSCSDVIRQNPNDHFIQQYHREGKQCLQNCKFGLQAPAEFGFNLKGDCDTRALLAFTILDHYGYDVAVLASDVYGHAILGIGLPYQGLYKSYNGVRYYAWELTAKDWQPGFLDPQVSAMNNWYISIINKQ